MGITGPRFRGEERERRLAAARQWRIDNKPYFDALYGPETDERCPECGQKWRKTDSI